VHWTCPGETGGVWARGCDKNRGLARTPQASNELSISAKIFDPSPTATRVPLSGARRSRSAQAKWRGEISKSRAWRWRTSSFAILQESGHVGLLNPYVAMPYFELIPTIHHTLPTFQRYSSHTSHTLAHARRAHIVRLMWQ